MNLKFWKAKKKPQTHRREYIAAKIDRLTASWTTTPRTSDEILKANLKTLRARSREQVMNNDYARQFMGMVRRHVIGSAGIIMQSRAMDSNGEMDKGANDLIEAAFIEWGHKDNCDVTGRNSWKELQRMFVKTVAQDGESITVILMGKEHGKWQFTLQSIDPELLDVDLNMEVKGGYIKMGIEFNQWEKPIAYHFIVKSIGSDTYTHNGKMYIRIPADRVIHAFVTEFVGQKRGIPWMSTALMRLNMLGGYEEAALVAARAGASKMGFFTTPAGDQYVGDGEDASGNIITDAEAGTFEQLPAGVEFTPYDPRYPMGEFSGFVKTCLRGIAAGLGVSYSTLANDLEGVSFSSGRIGSLEEREVWKELQEWVIDSYCAPIFEAWLSVALLNGDIALPLAKFDKFKGVSWQPRRWQWVDPLKDMAANEKSLAMKTTSIAAIIREQGRDPEEVWMEIARERGVLEGLGIAGTEEAEKEPEDEDEDEDAVSDSKV